VFKYTVINRIRGIVNPGGSGCQRAARHTKCAK
jgi:hypothetical protein